jgi:hypothetical protein
MVLECLAQADRITLANLGSSSSYYFDGQNWRRVGLGQPVSNDVAIPLGSSMLIQRPASGPPLVLQQFPPYNL